MIIVPCYNEALRLPVSLFRSFLAESRVVRILFVNDGSTDGTQSILEDLQTEFPESVEVLRMEKNSGKAEAVRRGLQYAVAKGGITVTGFWDADLAAPLSEIPRLLALLRSNPAIEIVLGSRVCLLGRWIQRQRVRHYIGRIFATLASLTLSLPVYDTQCGAKLFRVTDVLRQVLETRFNSRWTFDVEVLARYVQIRGSDARDGIYEEPLKRWEDVGGSKVKTLDGIRALGDLASIYRRYGRAKLPSTSRATMSDSLP